MPLFDSFSAYIRPTLAGTATLLLGLAASCTYSHGDPAPACDVARENVTYARVIAPIFAAHCTECHNTADANTRGAGFDFSNYQGINQYYSTTRLLGCIKRLPGYPPMPLNRDKLSDCDIQRIEAWITAGKLNN
jgi:cytochrome c553